MHTEARLITLHAITFLHPGTGRTTGVVDLPIQREVHTGYPMFAASGLKGSLRDKAERQWGKSHDDVETLFGSSVGGEDNPNAGALSVTDARILAFPVRSLQQVFIWVTCPMVLQRLQRDAALLSIKLPDFDDKAAPAAENAWVTDDSPLSGALILEDMNFTVQQRPELRTPLASLASLLAEQTGFDVKRLAVIPDGDFQHLVRYATQVSARIRLNDRKTTDGDGGNLWYEETLPPETVMYALALCHSSRRNREQTDTAGQVAEKFHALLADRFLQIGGNETVGQGWCCINVNGG
ncbi:MAG: type III-B CRISPR module RAMP protein Cmr4 [Gammaproteobacteria bacterium]